MNDYKGKKLKGKVIYNLDPEQSGKIKVVIDGILEGDFAGLPWCVPNVDGGTGMKANSGSFSVPELGSFVSVEFQDGDPQYPVYVGGFLSKATLPTDFKEDYPNTYGFVDEKGNKFLINKTKGTVKFTNSAGTTLVIKDDVVTLTTGTTNIISNVNITGNVAIEGGSVTHNGQNIGNTHAHLQNTGDHFGAGVDTDGPH